MNKTGFSILQNVDNWILTSPKGPHKFQDQCPGSFAEMVEGQIRNSSKLYLWLILFFLEIMDFFLIPSKVN